MILTDASAVCEPGHSEPVIRTALMQYRCDMNCSNGRYIQQKSGGQNENV